MPKWLLIVLIIFAIILKLGGALHWLSFDNKLNRLIKKIRKRNISIVETPTYSLHINKDKKYSCFFINKKTKWKNNLSKANIRTKRPMYYELKTWFEKLDNNLS